MEPRVTCCDPNPDLPGTWLTQDRAGASRRYLHCRFRRVAPRAAQHPVQYSLDLSREFVLRQHHEDGPALDRSSAIAWHGNPGPVGATASAGRGPPGPRPFERSITRERPAPNFGDCSRNCGRVVAKLLCAQELACLAAFLLISTASIPAAGARVESQAPTVAASYLGVAATYDVSASWIAPSGEHQATTVHVTSTVVGQDSSGVRITTVLDGGPGATTYLVPAAALARSLPGSLVPTPSGIRYSDSRSVSTDGGTLAITETGTTAEGWVSASMLSVTGATVPSYSLSVTLSSESGPVSASSGTAVLLVPQLLPPSDGARVLSTTASAHSNPFTSGRSTISAPTSRSAGGTLRQAAPAVTTDVVAQSILHTYDNSLANIQVWYSQFTLTGTLDNGAYTNFVADERSISTFPNWICTGWSADFDGTPNSTTATAHGQGNFEGFFPLSGLAFLWQGHAFHQTTLNLSDHTVSLSGEIDAMMLFPCVGCWYVWKTQTFYSGTSFPNDGVPQEATWYIIG